MTGMERWKKRAPEVSVGKLSDGECLVDATHPLVWLNDHVELQRGGGVLYSPELEDDAKEAN